jgi:predicted RNA-binding Zn-ribbon protein involved in translation (DUF1610 family)
MADNSMGGFNIHDAFAEYHDLSERDQQKVRQTQAGCDHAGVDDYGQPTTCRNAGTHVVFAYKHEDDRDVVNPEEVAQGGFEKFGVVEEGKPRNIVPKEEIKVYCPEHAEHAKHLLNAKVAKTQISDDGSQQTVVEAGKMPLHHLQESGDPDHRKFLRQHQSLIKQLNSALTLNILRHSGLVKHVPPRGYASGTTLSEEDAAEAATREEFGQTSVEAATGSNISDLAEGLVYEANRHNFVQDEAPTAMDAARRQIIEAPAEKAQTEAERKRVRTRLSKARAKNEYWCPNCEKSAKQNFACMDCGQDTVHSSEVESRRAGRPFKVDEAGKVEVTSNSLNRAVTTIKGNAVTVKGPDGEPVQLPSTVDNVRDFVAGKGYAPTIDFNVRGVHDKEDIAETHFAPTEDYEDPAGMAPNLEEGGVQYYGRTGGAAMFSGPGRADTGPRLGTESRTSITIAEDGSIVPVIGKVNGQYVDFAGDATGFTNVNENKSVKSRKRKYGLNVKLGQGVAPSTTCHECSLRNETSPVIRRVIKNANGQMQGVCAKGHSVPSKDIPVAWDSEKGHAIHVYPRPTGNDSKEGPTYHWIPTNEPALDKNGAPITKDTMNKFSPFRHLQEVMSRRTRSAGIQNLTRTLGRRDSARSLTDSPEFEAKMAAERQGRLNAFLELGKREASNPEAEAQRSYEDE